jgi:hypothetical protein
MRLRDYRDPRTLPEAEVEAVRDCRPSELPRILLGQPSGGLQKGIETVKDSRGPFPFDDLLANIKETGEAQL